MTAPPGRVAVIGAGATPLVRELLSAGLAVVAVDISSAAIETLRSTVGDSSHVGYVVADVRELRLADTVDSWHDRAVFHFLVDTADQQAYVAAARAAVAIGGHVVIATFGPGGPETCSGLPVARHDASSLAACFGAGFELTESFAADHSTPWGSTQCFTHAVFRRTVE